VSADGFASQRSRRRHCAAAWSMAASAPRLASAGARPLRNAASACQRSAQSSRRERSIGSRASTSAATSQASACSSPARADSNIAARRGCVPSASMCRPVLVMRLSPSSAPSACSNSRAAASAPPAADRRSAVASLPPGRQFQRQRASSTCAISGVRAGFQPCDCGHSRKAAPAADAGRRGRRAGRPEACEIATVSRREKPLLGS
jgi:hypothetical protein